jgi:Fe-S cluster biogenesis protein NfuA
VFGIFLKPEIISYFYKKKKMIVASPINIYAESTPNPNAMKFVANKLILRGSMDFPEAGSALGYPFVSSLFTFSFVKGVFVAENYITITKDEGTDWDDIIQILKEFIRGSFEEGKDLFETVKTGKANLPPQTGANEIENKIIDLLEEYIRPAVEGDGGAIQFKSFNQGVVTVILQGACSGCPSSTLTLKAGIENLLKRMVPEVTEVVSEAQ